MQKLPEAELDIMLALWETEKQPVPRTYFDEKMAYKNWTVNALNSLLSRLEDRGFVEGARLGKNKYYSAVVKREEYLSREGKGILQKLYRGSLKNFLLSVAEQDGINEAEIDELQEYLKELKESRSK